MILNITYTEENYIKAIYHLQQQNSPVNTNDLAMELKTAPASITDMLKKLKKKKLVHYKAYYGCHLTAEGSRAALIIVRRHRLWEFFLFKKLQFSWDEVHEIAEELEHVCNTKLINKLDAFLGFPRTDPHGDPIPDEKGHIHKNEATSLANVTDTILLEVTQIRDQSAAVLELLDEKNIAIGTLIEIKKKHAFDESLEVRAGNKNTIHISKELSQNILVKEHE